MNKATIAYQYDKKNVIAYINTSLHSVRFLMSRLGELKSMEKNFTFKIQHAPISVALLRDQSQLEVAVDDCVSVSCVHIWANIGKSHAVLQQTTLYMSIKVQYFTLYSTSHVVDLNIFLSQLTHIVNYQMPTGDLK